MLRRSKAWRTMDLTLPELGQFCSDLKISHCSLFIFALLFGNKINPRSYIFGVELGERTKVRDKFQHTIQVSTSAGQDTSNILQQQIFILHFSQNISNLTKHKICIVYSFRSKLQKESLQQLYGSIVSIYKRLLKIIFEII